MSDDYLEVPKEDDEDDLLNAEYVSLEDEILRYQMEMVKDHAPSAFAVEISWSFNRKEGVVIFKARVLHKDGHVCKHTKRMPFVQQIDLTEDTENVAKHLGNDDPAATG